MAKIWAFQISQINGFPAISVISSSVCVQGMINTCFKVDSATLGPKMFRRA